MERQNKKVNPERQRARFTKEFKLETVRLLDLGQKPATQLALELGVARNQLYKWQAQLQKTGASSAFRGPGRKPLDEQNELERLKRELKHRRARHPKKSRRVLCEGTAVSDEVIVQHHTQFRVAALSAVRRAARSGLCHARS